MHDSPERNLPISLFVSSRPESGASGFKLARTRRTGLVASRPTFRHVPEPMKLEKLGQKGSKETVTDDHVGIILVNGKLSWYRKPVAPRGTGSRRGTARILENIAYSLHVPWEPPA
ncbi:uncharacterized protein LOC143264015 isoform X1 [Megachile rotundata]|uniref:uncharacterized protein LOC143264015 isoform X1 n=1 Tax=Megachile rotundata TaxID=143995 RepID=UPI003FD03EA4